MRRQKGKEREGGILRVSSFSATYYEYGKNVSTTIYTYMLFSHDTPLRLYFIP